MQNPPNRYRRRLLQLAALLAAAPAAANSPRTIDWNDLRPVLPPIENPFADMSPEQLTLLGQLVRLRDREARGADLTDEQKKQRDEILRQLRAQKVPVEDLLKRREQLVERHRAQSQDTVAALDGKAVRLPGYVLPLEFDGSRTTDFLLVPWVGACVHTPPPPINQIVRVRPAKPFEVKASFDPVWVGGPLRVRRHERALFLVDGMVTVASGYAIDGATVVPYENPAS